MLSRQLRLYETICANSNINIMLDFEAHLRSETLIDAVKLLLKKHPYYKLKLIKLSDGSIQFAEKDDRECDFIYLESFLLNSVNEFDSWKSRFVQIGHKSHDPLKTLISFHLYSFENRHQLYVSINHSGIDGPGVFTTIKDICFYLDSLLSENENQQVEPRKFLDIHDDYTKYINIDLESLKNEEIISNDNFIGVLEPLNDLNNELVSHIKSEFHQLSHELTQQLVVNSKKNNATIQGALSAAVAISLLNEKVNPLKADETYKLVNSCPCNMRSSLTPKLSNEDLVCGSSALIWIQEMKAESSLWDIASQATESIKEAQNNNYGVKWWIKLKNAIPFQMYSIMSSSMGIVSLNENNLQHLKIKDLRFLGSAYTLQGNLANCMTHAFTFMNRFTFNLSYTYPGLSDEWAQKFSNNILKVLEYFANDGSKNVNLGQFLSSLSEKK